MSLTGWTETTVGQTSEFLTGFPFASSDFAETGIRLIRGSNVKRGVIDWSADIARYWPNHDSSLRAFVLRDGDIVIAMDGALVGRSFARITAAELPAYLVQRVARLRGKAIDQDLLYQWIGSQDFVKHVDDVKTHTAIPHISPRDIRDFKISIPTDSNEQRAVSAALRDADDLIATLERIIAKKQAIKQGMMQQLLTGRTRLPGFTSPWREATLGEVLKVRHGKSQRAVEVASGKYPILATGGQIGWASTPLYSKPSVLIGRKGTIDRPQYQEQPFWTVDTLFYTEISTSADPRFLYYAFLTIDWRSMNEASGVPSLSSTRVEGVEIDLPDLKEQAAIRKALDDSENEIELLKARLSKARAIKTGMMQQLLTGRVRLPVEVSA